MEVKRIYEAMFLFDPTAGNSWEHVEEVVARLMERSDGELIRIKKWDERRLAYEIEGRRRGVYVLCFFKAPTNRIVDLERDVQLSEDILRVLVLRRDDYSDEKINDVADNSKGYTPEPAFGDRRGGGFGGRQGGRFDDRRNEQSSEEAEEFAEDEADETEVEES